MLLNMHLGSGAAEIVMALLGAAYVTALVAAAARKTHIEAMSARTHGCLRAATEARAPFEVRHASTSTSAIWLDQVFPGGGTAS